MKRVEQAEVLASAIPCTPPGPEQEALPSMREETRRTKSPHSGARSRPQPQECSVLDERVPGLFFDSLTCVQAAILSASTNLPYSNVRQAMTLNESEKCELTRAALLVATKHAAFFSQHKEVLEIVVAWMGVNTAQADHLYSLVNEPGDNVCSRREAIAIGLIVLAPLALLALILILKHGEK